jgi:hypothetical protein
VLIDETDLEWPADFDGDGLKERFNLHVASTMLGIEAISVTAGTFPSALKFQDLLKTNVTLSKSGKQIKITQRTTQWLVNGVGMVKSEMTQTTQAFGKTRTENAAAELEGYRVEGETGGNVPSITLFENLGYEYQPVAIATDGHNYLAVTCRETGSAVPSGIIARIVSPKGQLSEEIAITPHSCEEFPNPAVAFDGVNYLVITRHVNRENYNYHVEIKGNRLSSDGQLLDQPGGFSIYSEQPVFDPLLAFDGVNYLVLWEELNDTMGYDIFGVLISPDGSISQRFLVVSEIGEVHLVDLTFDGSNYIILWVNNLSEIFVTRMSPSLDILEPQGILIANDAWPNAVSCASATP